MKRCFILLTILCGACFHGDENDAEGLRTVPITNNPNIVPNHGGGMPGFGGGGPH